MREARRFLLAPMREGFMLIRCGLNNRNTAMFGRMPEARREYAPSRKLINWGLREAGKAEAGSSVGTTVAVVAAPFDWVPLGDLRVVLARRDKARRQR